MSFSLLRHLGECPATLEAHDHQPPTQKVPLAAANTAPKPMIPLDLEATLLAIINILKLVPMSRSVIFYPFSDLFLIYFDFISIVSSPRPRL